MKMTSSVRKTLKSPRPETAFAIEIIRGSLSSPTKVMEMLNVVDPRKVVSQVVIILVCFIHCEQSPSIFYIKKFTMLGNCIGDLENDLEYYFG